MTDERNASEHEGQAEDSNQGTEKRGISEGPPGTAKQANPNGESGTADNAPKPSLTVRFIHFLWRRRHWPKIWKANHPGPNWAEITTVCLTLGVVIAAFIQAGIYWKQARIMELSLQQTQQSIALNMGQVSIAGRNAESTQRATDIAQESLTAVQRAFVFMDRADAEVVHPAPNTENVLFTFKWQNSGSTPATLFKSHINYLLDPNPMPKNFSFKDGWEPGFPRINVEGFIGPKAEVGMPLDTPISVAEIKAIAQHRGYLYVWGWAKYHDVFAKTPEHVSKFCVQIVPDFHVEGNVTKFSVGLEQCLVGHYTCVDSQCKP